MGTAAVLPQMRARSLPMPHLNSLSIANTGQPLRWLAGLLGLLVLPVLVAAQSPVHSRPSLEARIEALERQNAALRHQLGAPASMASPGRSGIVQTGYTQTGYSEPALIPPESGGAPAVYLSPFAPPASIVGAHPASHAAECPHCHGNSEHCCPPAAPAKPGLTAHWNHGLELQSEDKKFRVHVGGRTQVDAVFLQESRNGFLGAGGVGDGDSVNMRRGRLRVDGTMFEIIDFACEYDFVNEINTDPLFGVVTSNLVGVPAITDMWINVKEVPLVGNIKLGVFKDPIGFDHLHSSRYLNFLERSFNQDAFNGAFNNGFSPGAMIWDTYAGGYGTWATGVFKNTTNIFAWGVGDGEYAWTSRATFLPFYDEYRDGANLLHLGIAGSIRDPNKNTVQYRSRGSLRNGPPGPHNPVFANTGSFYSDQTDLLALELSWQWGPLQINAEWEGNFNQNSVGNGISAPLNAPLGTVFFQGWYVEGLYFLTGEHRDYDRKTGVYGRIIPHRNFHWDGGPGAWQIGVRYAQLDLRDTGINGGLLQDVTLGLNWFLNPNMKLQWNYVYMDRGAVGISPGGDVHGAGMRLAFDF